MFSRSSQETKIIKKYSPLAFFSLIIRSAEHNITTNQGQAIFAGALHTTYIGQTAQFFAGTARRAGFRGDIGIFIIN
jgi:hypothetical protein